jgi:hypothetical protein
MRAGYFRECCDQHVKDRAGGKRIRKQRDRGVAAREPFARNSRTNHGSGEKQAADELSRKRAVGHSTLIAFCVAPSLLPISFNFALNASSLRPLMGSAANSSIRR